MFTCLLVDIEKDMLKKNHLINIFIKNVHITEEDDNITGVQSTGIIFIIYMHERNCSWHGRSQRKIYLNR